MAMPANNTTGGAHKLHGPKNYFYHNYNYIYEFLAKIAFAAQSLCRKGYFSVTGHFVYFDHMH